MDRLDRICWLRLNHRLVKSSSFWEEVLRLIDLLEIITLRSLNFTKGINVTSRLGEFGSKILRSRPYSCTSFISNINCISFHIFPSHRADCIIKNSENVLNRTRFESMIYKWA